MNVVYEIVTQKIMTALENGIIPWRRPWKLSGAPKNYCTDKRYSGINVLLLRLEAETHGYSSNAWMTYKQAVKLGGRLDGQKGTQIVFCKSYKKEGDDEGSDTTLFSMRYYTVFNTDQVKGVVFPNSETSRVFDAIEAAESVVAGMPNRPLIQYGGDEAYYRPYFDMVQMPLPTHFLSPEYHYSALFHELAHSTGHSSRLGRIKANENKTFGSQDYSKEELVAEMAAAFLCGETDIDACVELNASYIQSWLEVLGNDQTLVVKAASAAQKAADYILGRKDDSVKSGNGEVVIELPERII